jgi:hypothetical protein
MWTWNEKSATWYYGTQHHGCGVFQDEETSKWQGNVSAYGRIHSIDGESKEQVQKFCLEHLAFLKKEFE